MRRGRRSAAGWECKRWQRRTRASRAVTMRRSLRRCASTQPYLVGVTGRSRRLARPTAVQRAPQLPLSSGWTDHLRTMEESRPRHARNHSGPHAVWRGIACAQTGRVRGSPPRLSEKELERLFREGVDELEAPRLCPPSLRVDESPQLALDSRPSATGSGGADDLPKPKMPRLAGLSAEAS